MQKKLKIVALCLIILVGGAGFLNWLENYQHEKQFKTFNESQHVKTRIIIPTYNQKKEGYPLGCEGVSLYMAMRGMGYLEDMDLKSFMKTMPHADNPLFGYWGDATKGRKFNGDKRTTIYPEPLSSWGSKYSDGHVVNGSGSTVEQLKEELDLGHPIVVYVTSGWSKPKWKNYSFGSAVTNNHVVCLVGYNESGDYLINDCSGSRNGEYWISQDLFENCYNVRHMAVIVTGSLPETKIKLNDTGDYLLEFENQPDTLPESSTLDVQQ